MYRYCCVVCVFMGVGTEGFGSCWEWMVIRFSWCVPLSYVWTMGILRVEPGCVFVMIGVLRGWIANS
jgi:hypothetical protein